ncbi:MAG: hypothetical protein C0404_06860 [Verrucomicrobia bacterium]|nr:hypothetical protein [Verrucomicrobiota bacterium]
MKSYLINTLVSFAGSPQGPARLYGYMRRNGTDTTFLNLNHDIYSYFFSTKVLNELLVEWRPRLFQALSRDAFFRRDFGSILIESSSGEMRRLLAEVISGKTFEGVFPVGRDLLARAVGPVVRSRLTRDNIGLALLGNIDEVTRRIGAAQEEMDRCFNRQSGEDYLKQFRTLLCGKAIIDAIHHPAHLHMGLGFCGTEWDPTADDLVRGAQDERHNYLIRYYRTDVLPRILQEEPGLVGLSVTHASELVPAFTLGKMIKDLLPQTHITLGGAAVSDIRARLAGNKCLWDIIDSIAFGPGEAVLPSLLDAVETGKSLSVVPNLIYRFGDETRHSEKTNELSPDDFTTPEYVHLRPGAGVGLETSSSCYWGKCRFCYYPYQGSSKREFVAEPCRQRSLDKVYEDMETLVRRHNPGFVAFTDSAVSPERLEAIAEYNTSLGLQTPFSAFVRFEKEFASEPFCRKLAAGGFIGGQAGLETGTERVNALINKGIDLKLVPAILRNFRRNNILIHVYSMVGFPGETIDEARETFQFIKRHRKNLTLDWQIYPLRVLENGPLARGAAEYGLELQNFPGNVLLPISRYKTTSGMSAEDSNRLSALFEMKLDRYRNPLSELMDVEMYKLILLWIESRRRGNALESSRPETLRIVEFGTGTGVQHEGRQPA